MKSADHCFTKLLPASNLLKLPVIHLYREAEIQACWRAEKLFKMLWISCLRQEGEDTAAVTHDANALFAGPEKSIQVSHRHAVADVERCTPRQQPGKFGKNSSLEEFTEILDSVL